MKSPPPSPRAGLERRARAAFSRVAAALEAGQWSEAARLCVVLESVPEWAGRYFAVPPIAIDTVNHWPCPAITKRAAKGKRPTRYTDDPELFDTNPNTDEE